jgi:predicted GNAT family acetyltransferase
MDNPIWDALNSGHQHFAQGAPLAKYYPEDASPFAGLQTLDPPSFALLASLLPPKRVVVTITKAAADISGDWKLLEHDIIGQMVAYSLRVQAPVDADILPLTDLDIPQMLELTKLTNPGPFGERTIEFGHYVGIFDGDLLIAMAGRRMNLPDAVEVSAVCTRPGYTGKGYAGALTHRVAKGIADEGRIPFLHHRMDNERAIKLYKTLGFEPRCGMHLNVLLRQP